MRVETCNIESKTLVNELRWVKSTKVKLLKMTEETPKIPAIEAKSAGKRVKVSNIKNKTLVNEVRQLKSTKVKLLKMTEETPKIPANK